MSAGREIVWMQKEQAEKFKKIESLDEQIIAIDEIISKRKLDIRTDMEALEEDMLLFKAFAVKYRNELKKLYDDQHDQAYALWEKYNEELPRIETAISEVRKRAEPLERLVEGLEKSLNKLESWKLDSLTGIIETIRCTDDKTRDMLCFLLTNYKG